MIVRIKWVNEGSLVISKMELALMKLQEISIELHSVTIIDFSGLITVG